MAALSIESDGDGWTGSFAAAVQFLAKDLLSDGEPVDNVSITTEEFGDTPSTITGQLTDCTAGMLTIDEDIYEIEDNIIRFAVD